MPVNQFRPRQRGDRNPLASSLLMAALDRLTPNPRARQIDTLVRVGRVADAAAVADRILIEADHV